MRIYAKVWQQDPKQVATYFPKYFGYEGEWTRGEFEKLGLEKMSEGLQAGRRSRSAHRLECND